MNYDFELLKKNRAIAGLRAELVAQRAVEQMRVSEYAKVLGELAQSRLNALQMEAQERAGELARIEADVKQMRQAMLEPPPVPPGEPMVADPALAKVATPEELRKFEMEERAGNLAR